MSESSIYKLLVCTNIRFSTKNKSCSGEGSEKLLQKLKDLNSNLKTPINIEEIKCFGQCEHAPVMRIAPAKEFFYTVNVLDLENILSHVEQYNNG